MTPPWHESPLHRIRVTMAPLIAADSVAPRLPPAAFSFCGRDPPPCTAEFHFGCLRPARLLYFPIKTPHCIFRYSSAHVFVVEMRQSNGLFLLTFPLDPILAEKDEKWNSFVPGFFPGPIKAPLRRGDCRPCRSGDGFGRGSSPLD